MGEILKFPGDAARPGYRRARQRRRRADDPNQLDLFLPPVERLADADADAASTTLSAFERALLCDERGDDRAAELYVAAIEQGDCAADACCNLGILESRRGNTAKAFDCFTTALQHAPRHSEAHYNLASLYFEVNDFRLAQIHYEIAAEVDPTFANVYFNLALVQSINHELPAAIATLTKYRQLVSPEEARNTDELLLSLRQSLAASQGSGLGS